MDAQSAAPSASQPTTAVPQRPASPTFNDLLTISRHSTPTPEPELEIRPALQRQIDAMSPTSAASRLRSLGKMSSYEFQKENNIAERKEELVELKETSQAIFGRLLAAQKENIDPQTELPIQSHGHRGGTPPTTQTLHASDASNQPTPTTTPSRLNRHRPSDDHQQESASISQDISTASATTIHGEDSHDVSAASTTSSKTTTRGRKAKADASSVSSPVALSVNYAPKTVVINKSGWPDHIEKYYGWLEKKEWGTVWAAALRIWTQFERALHFANPVSLYYLKYAVLY